MQWAVKYVNYCRSKQLTFSVVNCLNDVTSCFERFEVTDILKKDISDDFAL
jgi:hypothetical protein